MYKYIYWLYKDAVLDWYNLYWQKFTWNYDIKQLVNKQFENYSKANLVEIIQPLDNEHYCWKIPIIDPETEELTWEFLEKHTKFCMLKYSDKYINRLELIENIKQAWAQNNVYIFKSLQECIDWIENNTTLEKISDNKFKYNKFLIWETELEII